VYGDAYIKKLYQCVAEQRAKRAAETAAVIADPRAALREQVTKRHSALPPEARAPSYLMENLVRLCDATPQQLGLALRELGWKCERRWHKGEAYRHYWVPPDVESQQHLSLFGSNSPPLAANVLDTLRLDTPLLAAG
jgi:hypothetical protein